MRFVFDAWNELILCELIELVCVFIRLKVWKSLLFTDYWVNFVIFICILMILYREVGSLQPKIEKFILSKSEIKFLIWYYFIL